MKSSYARDARKTDEARRRAQGLVQDECALSLLLFAIRCDREGDSALWWCFEAAAETADVPCPMAAAKYFAHHGHDILR